MLVLAQRCRIYASSLGSTGDAASTGLLQPDLPRLGLRPGHSQANLPDRERQRLRATSPA